MNTKKKKKKKKKPRRRKFGAPARASKKKTRPKSRRMANRKKTALKRRVAKTKKAKRRAIGKKIRKKTFAKTVRIKKKARRKIRHKARHKKKRRIYSPKTVIRKISAKKFVRKTPAQKPTFILNTDFEFFYELRDLILKSSPAEKDRMIERLNKLGRIKLAIISGIFINKEGLDPLITDILIVGDDIDRRKLHAFLRATEAEVGREIKFTVMDKEEFQYRLAMFDRFIRVLLESPHEKLINRLGV